MSFQRRQLLQILSYAFGSSFILPQNELAMAAQNPAPPASPAPPAKAAAKQESEGCSSELMIPKRWGTGTCNTWGSRPNQQERADPFGSKRPDRPSLVPFPKRPSISGTLKRSGW